MKKKAVTTTAPPPQSAHRRGLNPQQQAVFDDVVSGRQSGFLTGEPGTGKTHLVRAITAELTERGHRPITVASTGLASTHIPGAVTAHKFFGLSPNFQYGRSCFRGSQVRRTIAVMKRQAMLLILEEISMFSKKLLDTINLICQAALGKGGAGKPFGGLQFLMVGDFRQLEPIQPRGEDAGAGANPGAPIIIRADAAAEAASLYVFHSDLWKCAFSLPAAPTPDAKILGGIDSYVERKGDPSHKRVAAKGKDGPAPAKKVATPAKKQTMLDVAFRAGVAPTRSSLLDTSAVEEAILAHIAMREKEGVKRREKPYKAEKAKRTPPPTASVWRLTQNMRQAGDIGFARLLLGVSRGGAHLSATECAALFNRMVGRTSTATHTPVLPAPKGTIELFPHNRDVDARNMAELRLLVTPTNPTVSFTAVDGGEFPNPRAWDSKGIPSVVTLARGARILITRNMAVGVTKQEGVWVEGSSGGGAGAGNWVGEGTCPYSGAPTSLAPGRDVVSVINGDAGYVTAIGGRPASRVTVCIDRFPGVEAVIERCTYDETDPMTGRILSSRQQLPIRLAWAITVHKAQGMTLPGLVVNLTGPGCMFARGMAYVAMSRVRQRETLYLCGPKGVDPNTLGEDFLRGQFLASDEIDALEEREYRV